MSFSVSKEEIIHSQSVSQLMGCKQYLGGTSVDQGIWPKLCQNLCARVSLEKYFSSMKNYFKFPYCFIFIFVILQLRLSLKIFVFLFKSKPSLVSLEEKRQLLPGFKLSTL